MEKTAKRKWLRLSGAMLFVLAIVAAWLYRNDQSVRERTRALNIVQAHQGDVRANYDDDAMRRIELQPVPWIRRALGDRQIVNISVSGISEAEAARIKRAFPDSDVNIRQ